MINNCTQQSSHTSQQSLKSTAIKGKERGVAVGGCRSSVAERWWLKPEALGSIPSGATFLSFTLPFQRSTDSNGPDCLSLDSHYQSPDCGGVPSIGLPHAVIMLTIHYDQDSALYHYTASLCLAVYCNFLSVARWLLSLLCAHKCAKPSPQVWGKFYPAVSVGSWWMIKCWRLYLDIHIGS